MNSINDDKYWTRRPPQKQPMYNRDKKSHEAVQTLKGALKVALRDEWQQGFEMPGELR